MNLLSQWSVPGRIQMFSELSSLLNCIKTWFCFRILYWTSYKSKQKKPPWNKSHTFPLGFIIDSFIPLAISASSHWFALQMLRQLCVHHLNITKARQICDRNVYSPVLQSLFVLCWVSVLHWSSLHAKPLVCLCEVQRLPEIMDVNGTTQMWHENPPPPPNANPNARITVQRDFLLCRIVNKSVRLA